MGCAAEHTIWNANVIVTGGTEASITGLTISGFQISERYLHKMIILQLASPLTRIEMDLYYLRISNNRSEELEHAKKEGPKSLLNLQVMDQQMMLIMSLNHQKEE